MKTKAIFLLIICAIVILIGCGLIRTFFYPPQVESKEVYQTTGTSIHFEEWNNDLQKYVVDGVVDYTNWRKNNKNIKVVLEKMQSISRSEISRDHLLAFYINAYNICTVQLMFDYPEVKSITDIPKSKRWDDVRWQVGKRKVSLNQLEHEILRKEFIEPRIHFAIVCASVGCPHLASFAYEGDLINEQLDEVAKKFFTREENLNIDGDTIYLSSILDWFRGDFVQDALATDLKWFGDDFIAANKTERLLHFVVRFAPEDIGKQISQDYKKWSISYTDYDWNLNGK